MRPLPRVERLQLRAVQVHQDAHHEHLRINRLNLKKARKSLNSKKGAKNFKFEKAPSLTRASMIAIFPMEKKEAQLLWVP